MADQFVTFSPGIEYIKTDGVRATLPVIGTPFRATGQAVNWLLGRGVPLAVQGFTSVTTKPGEGAFVPFELYFWVKPDTFHRDYVFVFSLSTAATASGSVPVQISSVVDVYVPYDAATPYTVIAGSQPTTYILYVSQSAASTAQELSIKFNQIGDNASTFAESLIVNGIHIFEGPQTRINNNGVDFYSCAPKLPIYDGSSADASVGGLAATAAGVKDYFRRGALFTYAAPTMASIPSTYGPSTNSASYVSIFDVNPSIQVPMLYNNSSPRSVKANVFAWTESGGTADIQCTMTNGDSATWTTTSTTPAWLGEMTLDCTTDDPTHWSTDGGIRSGMRDEAQWSFRCSSGHVYVAGIGMYDVPG